MPEYQKLLQKLEAVEVDFDPTAEHDYGNIQPKKIAFVPADLFRELLEFLGSQHHRKV